jgi:hypothetical protein
LLRGGSRGRVRMDSRGSCEISKQTRNSDKNNNKDNKTREVYVEDVSLDVVGRRRGQTW